MLGWKRLVRAERCDVEPAETPLARKRHASHIVLQSRVRYPIVNDLRAERGLHMTHAKPASKTETGHLAKSRMCVFNIGRKTDLGSGDCPVRTKGHFVIDCNEKLGGFLVGERNELWMAKDTGCEVLDTSCSWLRLPGVPHCRRGMGRCWP
ncbi:hypothetical protein LY76DRAFT_254591 [Colletotrichum caudatum]|nr:hypothetical protein LY76DRAFT_254591 [Colletotrichum caudatum]